MGGCRRRRGDPAVRNRGRCSPSLLCLGDLDSRGKVELYCSSRSHVPRDARSPASDLYGRGSGPGSQSGYAGGVALVGLENASDERSAVDYSQLAQLGGGQRTAQAETALWL